MNGSQATGTGLGQKPASILRVFGGKVAPAIARTLAAVTLATGLAVGATGTAAASIQSESSSARANAAVATYTCYYPPFGTKYIYCDRGWFEITPWLEFDRKIYLTSNGKYCGHQVWTWRSLDNLTIYLGWESTWACGF